MLDTSNYYSSAPNVNEDLGIFDPDANDPGLESEWTSAGDGAFQSDDSIVESINHTRTKLTSFRLLSNDEERSLATELASASREIAILTATWGQSARELLSLLISDTTGDLKKKLFSNSDHYFSLRSELNHLVNADGNAMATASLITVLTSEILSIEQNRKPSPTLVDGILDVDWPGPLMVALAKRYTGKDVPASALELGIEEYLSKTQAHNQIKAGQQPSDEHQAQLDYHTNAYLNARETMVNHNLKLVFHIAKRYTQQSDHMVDFIQEGACGLIRAAEKFRPATGNRFSTYAYQWIESKIRKARVNIERVVPISPEYNNDLMRLSQWTQQQKSKNTQVPLHDSTKQLNISKERLDTLIRLKQHSLSLDEKTAEEGLSLHARLADPDSNFAETVSDERRADYLDFVMQTVLTERESYVINERFGRLNSDPKTLQELSGILGISRERVRQLERGALEKLGNWMSGQASSVSEKILSESLY